MDIKDLAPKEVYRYFSDISSIPHGSANTDNLVEYCLKFAKDHEYEAYKDKHNNVVIFAKGTKGYENHDPVILQGHLDMVCEKTDDCLIDMENEGLNLCTDGAKVWAKGTTLGGDDGIAIAYILAVLDSTDIPHPPIEALFTSDEEIGLLGAREFEPNRLKSKRMINIDSEEEGVLFVSCAGGLRCACDIPFESMQVPEGMCFYQIQVNGLVGGHSGMEIHKQRENSIKLLGNVLACIKRSCEIYVSSIDGGGKENAIPKQAIACVCVKESDKHTLEFSVKEYLKLMHQELVTTEPELNISATQIDSMTHCMTRESTDKIIFAIQQVPNGLYKMSPEVEGMVQTSLNMGTCVTEENNIKLRFLIRSNNASGKQIIKEKLISFIEYLGGVVECQSDYPAWEYRVKSELRDICVKSFEEIYGKAPHITSIHAGLECGIFAGKMPELDMISFGPTLMNVHTPEEYMDVASVERSFKYLLKVLKNM